MMATNLDKFYDIETMMDEAKPLMETYLEVLEERHTYMSEYRSEYRKLRDGGRRAIQSLEKNIEQLEGLADEYEAVKKSISEAIDVLLEVRDTEEDTEELEVVIKALRSVLGLFNRSKEVNYKALQEAQEISLKYNIPISGLEAVMGQLEDLGVKDINVINSSIEELKKADNLYLSSFVEYRELCEDGDQVYLLYSDIVDDLLDVGLVEASEIIEDVLPEANNDRVKRPDREPLLKVLKPIKSSDLLYFQSKNKNSESYDLNSKFAEELAYCRRALLEDREYVGTSNAFDRVTTAFDELKDYMYDRYHQLGGTPVNYHGHDDRKR